MRWILLVGLMCASLVASEQSEKDYQKAVDQAKAEYDAKVMTAKAKFVVTLKAEMDAATKKGDLDGALALRTKIADLEPKKEIKKDEKSLSLDRLAGKYTEHVKGHPDTELVIKDDKVTCKGLNGTILIKDDTAIITWSNGQVYEMVEQQDGLIGKNTTFNDEKIELKRR